MLNHGRAQFEKPWLWRPIVVVFAAVVALGLAVIDRPTRDDIAIYSVAMVLLAIISLIGFLLHIQFDLTTQNVVVIERFLRGAPFLAPLLFANMGLIGLTSILQPTETHWQRAVSVEFSSPVGSES